MKMPFISNREGWRTQMNFRDMREGCEYYGWELANDKPGMISPIIHEYFDIQFDSWRECYEWMIFEGWISAEEARTNEFFYGNNGAELLDA